MPRVLYVTQIIPGRHNGGATATLALLHALRRKSWRVHLLLSAGADPEIGDEARRACDELTVLRRIRRTRTPWRLGVPCLLRHGYWPRFHVELAERAVDLVRAGGHDLLVLDHLNVIEVGRLVRRAGIPIPIVLREHNVEAELEASRLARVGDARVRLEGAARLRRLRTIEGNLARYCDLVLAISEVDAAKLRAGSPGVRVEAFGSPVDLERYRPAHGPATGKELVFVGGLNWPPNADAIRWFVDEVWPAVRQRHPDAVLDVAGDCPPEWLRQAPQVRALGFVPDEREVMARARAVIVPIRYGSGVRIKLLHALAMGKAVVSTRIGAEGVPVVHGRSALLADAPAEFAEAVCRALEDDACVERLGQNGLAVCRESFGPGPLSDRLDELLGPLVDRGGLARPGRTG